MNNRQLFKISMVLCVLLIGPASAVGDDKLIEQIQLIFSDVLEVELAGPENSEHGNHFKLDNVATSERIISTLQNFIGANIATFPLSSTSTGVTFDFSGGMPVAATTSTGPIFADRARTLGAQRLNVGVNVSHLNLAKLRGIRTEDIQFSFLHQDVAAPGLGDSKNEYDYIDLNLGLDVDATVWAFHGTYGVTDRIDVGVSIPVVRVGLKATPTARINSFTLAENGEAHHFFGGSTANPDLVLTPTATDASAMGIGDIALRAKINLYQGEKSDFATLLEIRLPTGDEENFLGADGGSIRAILIGSTTFGSFAPHFNIGYDRRSSDLDGDEIELTIGYDQKIADKITFAVDWLAEFEIGDPIEGIQFPEATEIGPVIDGEQTATLIVPPTNIPWFEHDHIIRSSFGIKYTPRPNLIIVVNVIVPLNDGGLRSDFIPTFGIEYYR